MGDGGFVAMSMIHVSVPVANNFIHSSIAADQGYNDLENWRDLSTACCRKERKLHHCLL